MAMYFITIVDNPTMKTSKIDYFPNLEKVIGNSY